MPNLYLENGKSGGCMLKSRIETIETGLKSMQGMNPAFATSRGLGLGEVLLFVSLGGVDGRPRISQSLPRLRWRRFWHACGIVGAAAHVARLHFSGDHLEDVWNLWRGTSWSALIICCLAEGFASCSGCHGLTYSYLLTRRVTHIAALLRLCKADCLLK
jgi:hypothetical protein